MVKIKIHPAFFLFAIILVLQNKFIELLTTVFAVCIHEFAHARVAYNCGYYMDSLTIMPYGAMLSSNDDFRGFDGVKISYAGPGANLLTCIALAALWWTFPTSYSYTKPLYVSSLTLGLFNLLPLFPLDGARILLSITKKPLYVLKILKGLGVVVSTLLEILFIASFFNEPNFSLGIMGAILYASQSKNTENEKFKLLSENCPFLKKMDVPIKKQTVVVHFNLKLIRLLRYIKNDHELTFEIVDDQLNPIKSLTENDVRVLSVKENLHRPIKELLYL